MSKPLKLLAIIALLACAALFLSKPWTNYRIAHWLKPNLAESNKRLIVARVFGQPITHSQLERAANEKQWLEGKSAASLAPDERKAILAAALDELIDDKLLRSKISAEEKQIVASAEEIAVRMRRLAIRFDTQNAFETAMKSQGISSEGILKKRIAARIQQEKFVELQIAQQIKVTAEEAQQWFRKNEKSLVNPERLQARHIFIPTLDHPPEEAKQKLDEALNELTQKNKDFPTLARELSEDPATKDSGGELGWMNYERLPADIAAPLFSLKLNTPTLIRSRLGWHLAEVTARKAAEPRSFEQAKPEILSALAAFKRNQAVSDYRSSLRKSEAKNIEIFQDAIPD